MLKLPKNLPRDIRAALQRCLSTSLVSEMLALLTESSLELFGAADALLSFEQSVIPGVEEKKTMVLRGKTLAQAPAATAQFVERWQDSGIHQYLRKDLEARLSSISFSAFSWPYPQLKFDAEGGNFSVPREYSLLLPFSSELIVSTRSEPAFFGYLALFFERFPDLPENTIQLIITLPEIMSEITAGYVRANIQNRDGDLSSYAHDIKRYLLVSREYLEQVKIADATKRQKAAAGMERSLLRVLNETNSILLADKDSQGNLQVNPVPLGLGELVEEVAADMRLIFEAADVQLQCRTEPRLPPVLVDPAIFPSVLSNILDNALKYSPPGSKVTVRTYADGGSAVAVEVADCGAAVPLDEQEKIFLKGYRGVNSQPGGGNGLGLYLARRIVEAHGGEVKLDQNGEKKFIVRLPVKR